MQSLDTGPSPRLNVRLPAHLRAAVKAAAGSGRGAESRWIRHAIENALMNQNVQSARKAARQ